MLNKYINYQLSSTKKFVRVLTDAPPLSKKEAEATAEEITTRRIYRVRDAFKAEVGPNWSGYWQEIRGFCEPFPDEVTNPTIRD